MGHYFDDLHSRSYHRPWLVARKCMALRFYDVRLMGQHLLVCHAYRSLLQKDMLLLLQILQERCSRSSQSWCCMIFQSIFLKNERTDQSINYISCNA